MPFCESCQKPGFFCSGVPGILASVDNCVVVGDPQTVERCDGCERYASDLEALGVLTQLGMIPGEGR